MLEQEKYTTGESVFVNSETGDDWVAEIIEIRAQDARNVFIEVAWFYKPEEVKGGRKPHHGEYEVLKSNHHDYIHVGSINGKANVVLFEEANPTNLDEADFFWRLQFDYNTQSVKGALKHLLCCNKPADPDKITQCPNCPEFFHTACLSTKKRKTRSDDSRRSKRKTVRLSLPPADEVLSSGGIVVDNSVIDVQVGFPESGKCPNCGVLVLS
jgi:hypothetical protein